MNSTTFSEIAPVRWGKIMGVGHVEFEVSLRSKKRKSEQAVGWMGLNSDVKHEDGCKGNQGRKVRVRFPHGGRRDAESRGPRRS